MKISTSAKQLYFFAILLIALSALLCGIYIWPNKNLEKAALQVTEIAQSIHKHYAQKINYWGLSSQYLLDNNILTNFSYNERKLLNALGKKVEIGQNENGDSVLPGQRNFVIAYTDLSVRECVTLAAYQFEHPEEFGLLSISIKNKDFNQSFDWGQGDFNLPISRQTAKKFCRNNSTVLWTIE